MVSLMASFVLSFFPLDVLDEIWDLIETVSEGFLTYSLLCCNRMAREAHPNCLNIYVDGVVKSVRRIQELSL